MTTSQNNLHRSLGTHESTLKRHLERFIRLVCPVHTQRQTDHAACNIDRNKKGKRSPYLIAECRVPELIPDHGSQPADDVAATSFAAW